MGNCFVHGFNLILGALATGGNGNLFSNSVAPRGVAFTAMDLDTWRFLVRVFDTQRHRCVLYKALLIQANVITAESFFYNGPCLR